MTAFSEEDLLMDQPIYTLRLTAAQRNLLEWLTWKGAVLDPVHVDTAQVADDCQTSVSTVYDSLARLTSLSLIQSLDGGRYRVNPRFYFSQNPEIARLAAEALAAPNVTPDSRAQQRRRASTADVRRRGMRPVS